VTQPAPATTTSVIPSERSERWNPASGGGARGKLASISRLRLGWNDKCFGMLTVCLRQALILLTLLFIVITPAHAYDEAKLKEAERLAVLLQAQLKGVAARISGGTLADEALANQRITLEKIRTAANVGTENATGPLNEIASQVSGLGPPPTDGTQELESIASQRKQLNAQLARATAAQKQFTLIGLEAEQTLARLTALQRNQFLQRIFKADRSILNPSLWTNTFTGASALTNRVGNQLSVGLNEATGRTSYTGFLFLPVGLFILGMIFFRLLPTLATRIGMVSATTDEAPTGLTKLWTVVGNLLKYILLLLAAYLLLIATLEATGFLTAPLASLLAILVESVTPALIFGGLIYFVMAPRSPLYRLVAIDNAAARSLVLIVVLGYLIYGFGEQLSAFASSINLPVSFAVGQSAVSALILIALLALGLIIVRREAMKNLASQGSAYFLTWFMNFMPLWWGLLLVAALALLFGFIALSYFIAGNLLHTAILAVAMGLVQAFTDALAAAAMDPHSRTGHALRRLTQWSEQGIQRFILILRTVADALLIIFSILALIALWTVVLFDVQGLYSSLSEGFRIGSITLSPKAIAIAIGVLAIGITATKYFTQWLDRRVLAETQFDKGVQNSLRAVAGYTGYILAAGFALSAAGINFSNFAIVAGALGVGIGFGLQSIVNNFVSGLILLAERPVRVGDWVVTNAGEGIVKKINVRSTEIETFDNCTIIVPNSNLISEAVRNWTHRDSVGRFAVNIAVTHTTDAETVMKQLEEAVQTHPKVMRHPPPTVQLAKISTQGLEFDIRGHLRDVFEAAQVASDIRMDIAKRLPHDILSSSLPPPKAPENPKKKS
jgi:potassium-dependent mechanosensitive channel